MWKIQKQWLPLEPGDWLMNNKRETIFEEKTFNAVKIIDAIGISICLNCMAEVYASHVYIMYTNMYACV